MRAAGRAHDMEMSQEQAAAAVMARQNNFLALVGENPLLPFPGVMDLMMTGIQHDAIRVGIATSSTREKSSAVLASAGIPYLDMVYVTGEDVANKKPDPELFLTAARQMKVLPVDCVVIEDSPDGVQSAKTAGCSCIGVTNSVPSENLSLADRVVSSLVDIDIDNILDLARQ